MKQLIFCLITLSTWAWLTGCTTTTIPASTPTAISQQAINTATTQPTPTLKPSPTQTTTSTATAPPSHTPTTPPTATNTPTYTPLPPSLTPTVTATNTPIPPLPTPDGVTWTLRVPILMYHYISEPPEDADIYRTDLSVSPENFRAQMQYLAENGYTTIDFYQLSRAIVEKEELPDKPVIITIDDGYRDNYTNAFPILQEYGLTATIFILTEVIDNGHEAYMTWPMVEEMAAYGIRMEPHSKNHPDLRGASYDALIWQILGSQQTVEAHIGYTPRYFSYPGGFYDENTIAVLQELGFWGAVTTRGGKWNGYADRYEWTRLRMHYTTTLPEFIDLVHPGQTVGGKRVEP